MIRKLLIVLVSAVFCASWAQAQLGGGGLSGGGGVSKIIAGTNVTISPTSGVGTVTINSSGGGGGSSANPSATIGLSAVNGVATTFMTSDSAPPLSQAIVPTWTGLHTFNPVMVANTANDGLRAFTSVAASAGNQIYSPALEFIGDGWATTPVNSQPVGCRWYMVPIQGTANPTGNLTLDCNVNGGAYSTIMTINSVANNTTTLNESLTVNALRVQGATVPLNGVYNPTTNVLGFATNNTARGSIGAKGELTLTNGILDTGTKFTAVGTGCTIGTTTGGATVGTFTLATGPCTSVVITMAGATGITAANGWSCSAHDRTSPTILIGGESSSTTTTATITIPAGAGATDVISFDCRGF